METPRSLSMGRTSAVWMVAPKDTPPSKARRASSPSKNVQRLCGDCEARGDFLGMRKPLREWRLCVHYTPARGAREALCGHATTNAMDLAKTKIARPASKPLR